jgi:hypothetical protein
MEIAIGMGAYDHKKDKDVSFDGQVKIEGQTVKFVMDEIGITLDMDAAELMQAMRTSLLNEKGLL